MIDERALSSLDAKLNLICAMLFSDYVVKKNFGDRDQVAFLAGFGLQPDDIARVLSKTPNAIHVAMSKLRKQGKL